MPAKKLIPVEYWYEVVRCRVARNRRNGRKEFSETHQSYCESEEDGRKFAKLFRLGPELDARQVHNLRYHKRGLSGFRMIRRTVCATSQNGRNSDYRFGYLVEPTKPVKLPLWH